MKRLIVLGALVVLMGVFGSNCQAPAQSGGGSLFSAGPTETSFPVWDMMFMVNGSTTCPKSFADSGVGLSVPGLGAAMTGGLFPGVKVTNSGYEYDADVPEVSILTYYLVVPGAVNPGDTIVVHFTYQANTDGQHGDYFLVRIVDGDLFHVPVQERGLSMALGATKTVNYAYIASADSFSIQFIVGLGDPADAFYLDDLTVRIAGAQAVADNFEAGVYAGLAFPGPGLVRLGLRPTTPGPGSSFGLQAGAVLEGTQSLGVTGGRYFQLYGQGASMGGMSAVILTYADPDFLDPFFGQTQAALQGGIYQGDYLAYDNAVTPSCSEQGQVMIAPYITGNADLSGVWYLTVDAVCDDTVPTVVHTEIGNPLPPHAAGDPVSIANVLGFFQGYDTATADGDSLSNIMGLSLGDAGFINMDYISGGATRGSARLVGAYDANSGVFAGQVLGVIPKNDLGNGVCVVTSGTFLAVIDSTVFIPPPP